MQGHSLTKVIGLVGIVSLAGAVGMAQQMGAPTAGGQQPAAPQVRTASLAGRVVDADTGEAIGGATVRLQMRTLAAANNAAGRGGRGAVALSPSEMAAQSGTDFVMADSDGRFVFHTLPKGPAQLVATATGYVERPSPAGVAARPVQITEDGQHIDGHLLRLVKAASISGVVTDEAGEPLVGVVVRVMRREIPQGVARYTLLGNARTDDRGMYRLDALVPGQFLVLLPQTQTTTPVANIEKNSDMIGGLANAMNPFIEAISGGMTTALNSNGVRVGDQMWQTGGGMAGSLSAAPPAPVNGRVAAYPTTFFPGVSQASQAMVVSLRSGEQRTGVDWQVRPSAVARISGTVSSPDGPAGSVSVRLLNAPGTPDDDALPVAIATSAPDGAFTFVGVPSGSYVVKAQLAARGGGSFPMFSAESVASLPAEALGMLSSRMGGDSSFVRTPVSVGDKDVNGLVLALKPGARVLGHVVFDGATAPPTAQQIQNAQVSLTSTGGNAPSSQPAKLAADLTFKSSTYAPGNYTINVTGVPAAWMLKSAMVAGRDAATLGLELGDADVADMVITFTDRVSSIAGTVRVDGTAPLPNATVIMIPADFRAWLAGGAAGRGQVLSGAQPTGVFNIARVAPGDYLLAALPDEALVGDHDLAFYDALSRVATRVAVTEGEKKSVELRLVRVLR